MGAHQRKERRGKLILLQTGTDVVPRNGKFPSQGIGTWDVGDEYRADQHMDMSLMDSFIIVHRGALFQAGNPVRTFQ